MTTSYNPRIPQPEDLPSDSQEDIVSNFQLLNQYFGRDHIPFGNSIENATSAMPIVITSTNHRLATGNTVTVANMEGTNPVGEKELWPINGNSFTVTVIDANTFSLDGSNGTTFPAYNANSGDFSSTDLPYGFHLQNTFPNPQSGAPNRPSPRSAYYTKNVEQIIDKIPVNFAQLFFQNGMTATDEVQLTKLPEFVRTANGVGFKTPWGWIINIGQVVAFTVSFTTYAFPLPYSTVVYSFTASKGQIRQQTGGGTKSIAAQALNLTQFQCRYTQNSGGDGSAYMYYMAIGV